MFENGIVMRVLGDMAEVRFIRSGACAQCRRCGLAADDGGEALLRLSSIPGLAEGDSVTVELPEGNVLIASLIAYGIPLGALVAGALLGPSALGAVGARLSEDLASLAGSLGLTLVSFVLLRGLNPRFAARGRFSPRIVSVARR